MTTTDTPHRPEESILNDGRYAGLRLADAYVVYDTEAATGWIQSDTAVSLDEVR